MTRTPKTYLGLLDMVTAPSDAVALPESLGAAEATHVRRVRSIFEDKNIVGAGVTEKITDGQAVGELSLCFYVRRKIPPKRLSPDKMLPPVMAARNGQAIFTDVIEIGDVVPQATPLAKRRPIQSGFSVGHFNSTAGTVGAIVRRGSKQFVLSNAHVLAEAGTASKGDDIYYPGPHDGGIAADTIAKLSSFKPFTIGETFTNKVDAALAEILADRLTRVNADIHGAGTPLKIGTPQRDMKLVAMGRTSGKQRSVVRDADFRILVPYPDVGTVGFTGQVRCDRWSAGGDSGSLMVDADTGHIVGLHFAGSPEGSIFTPIKTVMAALRFKF